MQKNNSWLKLVIVCAAIGFVILFAVLVFQITINGGVGPKLQVDRDKVDFGLVVFGKRVRAEFTLKNIGDQPLQLDSRDVSVRLLEGC